MLPLIIAAGVALVGSAAAIYYGLQKETEKARNDYIQASTTYYININNLRQRIEEEKEYNRRGFDNFKVLAELHFQSFKQADFANTSINNLYYIIKCDYSRISDIKKSMNDLYNTIKTTKMSYDEKNLKNEELQQLKTIKIGIYADIDDRKEEQQKLINTRKEFNIYTHSLKEFIRDNCGKGGRMWYERLENRIKNKKT